MKHSTPDMLKFQRLQRRLKESRRGIVGLLELLWISTQKNCPEGDIGRFSNEDIAILCDWEGDPEELVNALVETGWLDRSETHRLLIHDWDEHCPNYIRANFQRYGKTFAKDGARETPKQAAIEAARDGAIADTPDAGANPTEPTGLKNPTGPDRGAETTGRSAGVLKDLKAADLKDSGKLSEVYHAVVGRKGFTIPKSEHGRLLVEAAALRAMEHGDNPPALFLRLLKDSDLPKLVEAYIQAASARMRQHDSRAGPPPIVASLAARFQGGAG